MCCSAAVGTKCCGSMFGNDSSQLTGKNRLSVFWVYPLLTSGSFRTESDQTGPLLNPLAEGGCRAWMATCRAAWQKRLEANISIKKTLEASKGPSGSNNTTALLHFESNAESRAPNRMNIIAARSAFSPRVTPHLGVKVLGDFGKVLCGCNVGGWLAAVRALRPQWTWTLLAHGTNFETDQMPGRRALAASPNSRCIRCDSTGHLCRASSGSNCFASYQFQDLSGALSRARPRFGNGPSLLDSQTQLALGEALRAFKHRTVEAEVAGTLIAWTTAQADEQLRRAPVAEGPCDLRNRL